MLNEAEFHIAQLIKHTGGKQVMWSLVFRDKRIYFTTAQLTRQTTFRRVVVEAISELPPRRTVANFDRWIDGLMRNSIEQKNTGPMQKGR